MPSASILPPHLANNPNAINLHNLPNEQLRTILEENGAAVPLGKPTKNSLVALILNNHKALGAFCKHLASLGEGSQPPPDEESSSDTGEDEFASSPTSPIPPSTSSSRSLSRSSSATPSHHQYPATTPLWMVQQLRSSNSGGTLRAVSLKEHATPSKSTVLSVASLASILPFTPKVARIAPAVHPNVTATSSRAPAAAATAAAVTFPSPVVVPAPAMPTLVVPAPRSTPASAMLATSTSLMEQGLRKLFRGLTSDLQTSLDSITQGLNSQILA
ncbi:hypothetical protein BDN72DRAFT_905395, partial [Pluteus cervinus]